MSERERERRAFANVLLGCVIGLCSLSDYVAQTQSFEIHWYETIELLSGNELLDRFFRGVLGWFFIYDLVK